MLRAACRLVPALTVLVVTTFAGLGAARAQTEDAQRTALARTLFQQGLTAVDAHDWSTAADRFARAYELRQSSQVRLNLALALIELGHYLDASEHLRAVEADASAPEAVRSQAREALSSTLGHLGRLTVRVTGPSEGTTYVLDDHPLSRAAIGVETPVDPGTHSVGAFRAGSAVAQESVDVAEGQSAEVTLAVPLPRVVEPPPPPAPVRADDAGGVLGKWWFWTLVVVAVAGGAATAAIIATSQGGGANPVYGNTDPPTLEVMVMP